MKYFYNLDDFFKNVDKYDAFIISDSDFDKDEFVNADQRESLGKRFDRIDTVGNWFIYEKRNIGKSKTN